LLVVGEVLVEGGPCSHAGFFQFNHYPGQAIDETDQVGPAGVERAGDAELADQQEVVVLRLFPIDHAQAFGLLAAVLPVGDGYRDAFLEQPIDLEVGGFQAHRRAVAGQFIDGVADGLWRQRGVEFAQRGAQTFKQHRLAPGLPPQRTTGAEGFLQRRHRLPAKRGKQADGGLLDELGFVVCAVGVLAHFPSSASLSPISACSMASMLGRLVCRSAGRDSIN
jgi:hypothetical protein